MSIPYGDRESVSKDLCKSKLSSEIVPQLSQNLSLFQNISFAEIEKADGIWIGECNTIVSAYTM